MKTRSYGANGARPRSGAIPLNGADATFQLSPQQPAALASVEVVLPRTVVDVVALGPDGEVHHVFWDSLAQLGRLAPVRAPQDTLAQGRDVAEVRSLVDTLVIVGVDPAGRLVSMQGDATLHLATGLSTPVVIDPIATFRRCAGPALVAHGDSTMDVIAIDDGGNMRASRGTTIATIGTGSAPPVGVPPTVVLDPAVRPALVATAFGLVAIAADTNGILHFAELSVVPPVLQPFAHIDAAVTLAGRGPVALVATSTVLAAIARSTRSFGFALLSARWHLARCGRRSIRQSRSLVPPSEEELFPECELPHTSRPIPERCCLRVGGSGHSSGECRSTTGSR